IWFMNGTAIAGAGGPGALDPAQWSLSGAGDFDGDRRADLLWRNDVTGETWVWLMSGPAIVHAASLGNPGTAWAPKAIADLTGDGRADIVLRQGAAATYLWVMSGAAIAAQGDIPNPGGTWELAAP
ncbi:MAG TPA: VCBS repeat-containing protein, partial [Usitatibacteraceae bacterium]|nr:VCBS repeat-containing protein [Usitatibacteraceae bacterium]